MGLLGDAWSWLTSPESVRDAPRDLGKLKQKLGPIADPQFVQHGVEGRYGAPFPQRIAPGIGDIGPAGVGPSPGQRQATRQPDLVSQAIEADASRPRAAKRRGSGGPPPTPKGIAAALMRRNPGMTKREAREMYQDYKLKRENPGLFDEMAGEGGVDPATMQMFFQQTVAPYMAGINQKYQAGADAGIDAMRSILSQSSPSPMTEVLKKWLPAEQAMNNQVGAAMQAATISAPYYDQLINQLQENINQQQQTQFYNQQLLAGGGGTAAASTEELSPSEKLIAKALAEE